MARESNTRVKTFLSVFGGIVGIIASIVTIIAFINTQSPPSLPDSIGSVLTLSPTTSSSPSVVINPSVTLESWRDSVEELCLESLEKMRPLEAEVNYAKEVMSTTGNKQPLISVLEKLNDEEDIYDSKFSAIPVPTQYRENINEIEAHNAKNKTYFRTAYEMLFAGDIAGAEKMNAAAIDEEAAMNAAYAKLGYKGCKLSDQNNQSRP